MDTPADLSNATLETSRLILRPFEEADLADFYAYASVPGVGEMAGWPHHTSMAVSREILRSFRAQGEVLAVFHKEDQQVIGSLGLHKSWASAEPQYRHLKVQEIGYVLSKAYWGQGLMPEATKEVIDYGFGVLGLDAFTCGHFTHNNQSRRVIEKLGFTFLDQDVYHAKLLQQHFDHRRYILTREQWQAL